MTGRTPFEVFSAAAVLLLRDDVDTDQIIPGALPEDGLA